MDKNKITNIASWVVIVTLVLGVLYFMNRPDGPPGGKVSIVTDSTFNALVTKSDTPVAVEFRSPYCGACKMFRHKFENASEKYDGRVKFYELDINSSPDTADRYGIQSLPTTILFTHGESTGVLRGNVSADELDRYLNALLKRTAEMNAYMQCVPENA